MKKILSLIALIAALVLVGCADKPVKVLGLDVLSESVSYGEVIVSINVANETYSEKELLEIANAIASNLYLKHSDAIGQTKTQMTINLFSSAAKFEADTLDLGYVVYQINSSSKIPGIGSFESHITPL